MFNQSIYKKRRHILKQKLNSGLILFMANKQLPMNYSDNTYHFRQDSTFLYYTGINEPGIALLIDVENDSEILLADELEISDIIWMGRLRTFAERAGDAGISEVHPLKELENALRQSRQQKRPIHFISPYQAEIKLELAKLLDMKPELIAQNESVPLLKAIIEQRSVKESVEIEEIENAHHVTRHMHTMAMRMASPGLRESEIAGTIEGIALKEGNGVSFPVILSVHGEVLHNHGHANIMREGNLLVNDSGAESRLNYAADITRTIPVSGVFSSRQKDIYEIVLKAQQDSINLIKPGIPFKQIHLQAAGIIAQGLKDLGLMKGDCEEAVQNGAHALFFPHGLGHMMGLDVHDMENLGENLVGYDDSVARSQQFGLAYLRLAKKLQPGYVVTVEPGLYFIPDLIQLWKSEAKFTDFIDYSKVEKYLDFGGIRIEDDILVDESGSRVLGKPIPKTVSDVEDMCSQALN